MGVGSLAALHPAVFLDRDGVINEADVRNGKPHPPADIEHLTIVPGAATQLHRLRARGFRLIVVTNQPDVARGKQTRDAVEAINAALNRSLPLDDILVCYHDDAAACDCRKPQPGLVLRGALEHRVDLNSSFLVGDRWKDIEAGRRAGLRTIFVDYAYDEPPPDPPADLTVWSLDEAVDWIIAQPM